MLVTRLQVGPHNRDQQPWNRQLLMLEKLPVLFPCLREIDFDQVTFCIPSCCNTCTFTPHFAALYCKKQASPQHQLGSNLSWSGCVWPRWRGFLQAQSSCFEALQPSPAGLYMPARVLLGEGQAAPLVWRRAPGSGT